MKKLMLVAGLALLSTVHLMAQKAEVFSTSNQAIHGYDPVSYFKDNKAVKGSEKFVYKWKDANWYFSSKENMEAFKKSPEKYSPQYGGYCAYGLSEGHKAPTEPDAFTIVNGKLYLNYNVKTRDSWSKNKEERIKKADANWTKVKDQE